MLNSLLGKDMNSNLYVAGLPPSTSEEMMRQLFKEFGEATWHHLAAGGERGQEPGALIIAVKTGADRSSWPPMATVHHW
eukprot:Skav224968  [mRNA]  locus=scaffold3807:23238:23474:+ [translate_table: standard]